MSTHPNVILFAVLLVDGTARKTLRAICADHDRPPPEENDDVRFKVGEIEYSAMVMEDDYDTNGMQIAAPEGSIVFHDFLTYGYGEVHLWDEAKKKRDELAAWMDTLVAKHGGSYQIKLTANYW